MAGCIRIFAGASHRVGFLGSNKSCQVAVSVKVVFKMFLRCSRWVNQCGLLALLRMESSCWEFHYCLDRRWGCFSVISGKKMFSSALMAANYLSPTGYNGVCR